MTIFVLIVVIIVVAPVVAGFAWVQRGKTEAAAPGAGGGWNGFVHGMGHSVVVERARASGFQRVTEPEQSLRTVGCPDLQVVRAHHPTGLADAPIDVTFEFARDLLYDIKIKPANSAPPLRVAAGSESADGLVPPSWTPELIEGLRTGLSKKYGEEESYSNDSYYRYDWKVDTESGRGLTVSLIDWKSGSQWLQYEDDELACFAMKVGREWRDKRVGAIASKLEL